MLKMMTSGMFVMGLVTAPVVLSPRHAPAPAADYRNDPRLETLRTFFRNAACPAVEYAAAFLVSHSDLYKDKELDALLATYNPNLEYRRMVKSVMQRIAPAE